MCKNKLGRSENWGLLKRKLSWVGPKLKSELCAHKTSALNVQKIWGGEEKQPLLEAVASFHSLSKSNVICALIYEQVQHFSEMLWHDFFSRYSLQFALHLAICYDISGKIRLNRFYADIKALLPWLLFVIFLVCMSAVSGFRKKTRAGSGKQCPAFNKFCFYHISRHIQFWTSFGEAFWSKLKKPSHDKLDIKLEEKVL